MTIELPWPPSVNDYYRRDPKTGARYLKNRGRQFRETVMMLVRAQSCGPAPMLMGPLDFAMAVYPPDHRRHDSDNLLKAVQDALEHAMVYDDDSQLARKFIESCAPVEGGKVIVTVGKRGTVFPWEGVTR